MWWGNLILTGRFAESHFLILGEGSRRGWNGVATEVPSSPAFQESMISGYRKLGEGLWGADRGVSAESGREGGEGRLWGSRWSSPTEMLCAWLVH